MEDYFKHKTCICEHCGEEIDRGLLMAVAHSQECKYNAPNENIDLHHSEEERNRLYKEIKKKDRFPYVLNKLNEEELGKYFRFISVGIPLGNNALGYGSEMMGKIQEFKNKMVRKYDKRHKQSKSRGQQGHSPAEQI